MTSINDRESNTIITILNIIFCFSCFEIEYLYHFSKIFKFMYIFLQVCIVFSIMCFFYFKLKKINYFDIFVFIFIFFEFYSSSINHQINISLFISTIKLLALFYTAKFGISYNVKQYVKVFANYLMIITFLNTISSILVYPNALFYDQSDLLSPLFFIGGDNTSIRIYILCILFNFLNYNFLQTNFKIIITNLANMLLFCLVRDLGTGKVCWLIIVFGIIYLMLKKTKIPRNIIYIILIVQIVLFVILVLISNIDIFSYFIINVLNRDLTLTDRTVIWKITIEKIIQKPLFGNGYVYGKDFQRMLPYIIGVNAHNTYLMIMFIGGFVLFSVLIIIFIITIKKYDNRDHKKLMFILPLMLFVMMTRAQVEGGDINYIIFLVYMIYNYKNLERYTCSFKERRKQIKCKID